MSNHINRYIDAHMQALTELRSPSATLTSLREFHDSVEGHICSLASLGKSQESYGALLVTIILGKMPAKIKQNLARVRGRQGWKIDELQRAILDEIYILEAGSQTDTHTSLPPTASFHTGAVNKPVVGARSKRQCPFCKGPHFPTVCDIIKDPRQRSDFVRQEKLFCHNPHYILCLLPLPLSYETSGALHQVQPGLNGKQSGRQAGRQNTGYI